MFPVNLVQEAPALNDFSIAMGAMGVREHYESRSAQKRS